MGMDSNASLYRPNPHDPSTQLNQVCAVCRHRIPPPDRSVCDTCVPPDEGEVIARANARSLEKQLEASRGEVRMLQQACGEHVERHNLLAESHETAVALVRITLAQLDQLATVWGDEGVFRSCRDRLRSIPGVPL
jgi:hypothetical protein